MRSALPKMLHPVAGRPMVAWSVKVARELGARDVVVVTGHGADQVEAALRPLGVRFARQAQQLGTGHAFLTAARLLQGGADVLLLYGDSPMLSSDTLRAMLAEHREDEHALTVLTSTLPDATGYGRIIRGDGGEVLRIVEQKDATPDERVVQEFNSGVYLMDEQARTLAEQIGNDNEAGEYYITDLLRLYRESGHSVLAYHIPDPSEVMGANDRVQLAELERLMQRRIQERHMRAGVTLQSPGTTRIEDTVEIGPDCTVEPGVVLRGQTRIGAGVQVGAHSVLDSALVHDRVLIRPHTLLEGCEVGEASEVGPFARLRPGAALGTGVHVGNFVEIKNAQLHAGVKAGHLAYLGDVSIGEQTNIGAGTIVANFDGLDKHRTQIGAGVFVGSNSTLVAPRVVGDAAFIAAGSTIHEDVPEGAMAVARGRQRTLEGWSRRYWGRFGERLGAKLPWLAGWLTAGRS
ncbi:bifunctional UDP-N-acetylglucosamine diphosphorylase/glucosamine-1-phosphate N-acetyltransferase GlmU [Deinococcus sonorensis]